MLKTTEIDNLLAGILSVVDTIAADKAPEAAFRAVDRAVAACVGHGLFTILLVRRDGVEVERAYSSRPDAYPVGGRKCMGPTPWGDLVITRRESFLGTDPAAIRWAFPDHELIASLGLGSVVNVPVLHGGEVLGVLAVLDREGALQTQAQVETVRALASLLVPALTARRECP
jgi:GAF domain-containing protein